MTTSLAAVGVGVVGTGAASATATTGDGTAASFTLDKTAVVQGGTVTIDATASTAGTSGDTLGYQFACGATGVAPVPVVGTPGKATCTYPAAGTFSTDVTVTENEAPNGTNTAATQSVTVTPTPPPPPPPPPTAPVVARAAGQNRYDTGILLSQHRWASAGGPTTPGRTQADAVVLATGDGFPDALSGGPLAKKKNGPLLLTDGSLATVNPDVLIEIRRILPTTGTTIYILGGPSAVSPSIQTQLQGLGYTVTRYGGLDRFATSLQIAREGMGDPTHIVVARGDQGANNDGFADALSAGPYAADIFGGGNAAIILSNGPAFDPITKGYVASKLDSTATKDHPIVNVAAIGGAAATAMSTVPGLNGFDYGTAVGRTRYDTARIVASQFGLNATLGVATGTVFADALTGGAYMASIDGPLLLTDPLAESPETAAAIGRVATATREIDIFGGIAAVAPPVVAAIQVQVNQPTLSGF